MEQLKHFVLTVLVALVSGVSANAHDFEVDGIYYNILSTQDLTCEVTYEGSGSVFYQGEVNIPSSVVYNNQNYDVTEIGDYAFNGCTTLASVTIPNSVTKIGDVAFFNCIGITSITIPYSVTEIGGGAFRECRALTAVYINDLSAWCKIRFDSYDANPLMYAHNLYLNNQQVTNLVIPDDVTSIGYYAFGSCSGLISVTIPNSVTSIGSSAFESCSGLTTITIPNSVTTIGAYAFLNCSGLTTVTIPNGVTTIGNAAFEYCSEMKSVTIPNSVTTIGNFAFNSCI